MNSLRNTIECLTRYYPASITNTFPTISSEASADGALLTTRSRSGNAVDPGEIAPAPSALPCEVAMPELAEQLVSQLLLLLSTGLHDGVDLWPVLETLSQVPGDRYQDAQPHQQQQQLQHPSSSSKVGERCCSSSGGDEAPSSHSVTAAASSRGATRGAAVVVGTVLQAAPTASSPSLAVRSGVTVTGRVVSATATAVPRVGAIVSSSDVTRSVIRGPLVGTASGGYGLASPAAGCQGAAGVYQSMVNTTITAATTTHSLCSNGRTDATAGITDRVARPSRLQFAPQLVRTVASGYPRSPGSVKARILIRLALNMGCLAAALELIARHNRRLIAPYYKSPELNLLFHYKGGVDDAEIAMGTASPPEAGALVCQSAAAAVVDKDGDGFVTSHGDLWEQFQAAVAPIGGVPLSAIEAGAVKGISLLCFSLTLFMPGIDDDLNDYTEPSLVAFLAARSGDDAAAASMYTEGGSGRRATKSTKCFYHALREYLTGLTRTPPSAFRCSRNHFWAEGWRQQREREAARHAPVMAVVQSLPLNAGTGAQTAAVSSTASRTDDGANASSATAAAVGSSASGPTTRRRRRVKVRRSNRSSTTTPRASPSIATAAASAEMHAASLGRVCDNSWAAAAVARLREGLCAVGAVDTNDPTSAVTGAGVAVAAPLAPLPAEAQQNERSNDESGAKYDAPQPLRASQPLSSSPKAPALVAAAGEPSVREAKKQEATKAETPPSQQTPPRSLLRGAREALHEAHAPPLVRTLKALRHASGLAVAAVGNAWEADTAFSAASIAPSAPASASNRELTVNTITTTVRRSGIAVAEKGTTATAPVTVAVAAHEGTENAEKGRGKSAIPLEEPDKVDVLLNELERLIDALESNLHSD